MSIRYRLKRSSSPVHEPIPAHPDAIYRPQYRPTPSIVLPVDSGAIAPRLMDSNPAVAAPLAAGGSGFSPWWIIGPLLALIAAMALGTLAYAMKKKHDSKKQVEEENDPGKREINDTKTNKNKEENLENEGSIRNLRVENVPLRSMKSDTITNEQKRTVSMSSTAKDNSRSGTDPFLPNEVNNEQFDKSALSLHGLSLTNNTSTLTSIHPDSAASLTPHPPINVTRMTRPNSGASKQLDEKNTSKTVHNTLTDPVINSPLKNIRSVSTHKTKPNDPGNLPPTSTISPTSSTASTTQKLGQPNDGLGLNADKLKSDSNSNKKENQSNDFEKAPDDKSSFDQSLTNVSRVDHSRPLKAGQNNKEFPFPSSRSGINDLNADKLKSNTNLNKEKNQSDDFKKVPDDKSPFGQSLTNLGRVDHTGSLKAGQSNKESILPSSRGEINDQNVANKTGDDHINEPDSPEQHGIGKSSLTLNIPTGSKRSGKEKPQSRTNHTEEEEKSVSKSSSSSSNLQQQHSSKENIHSNKSENPSLFNINKDKQASTLTIHSKHNPLSEPSEITSSNSVTSAEPANEKNLTSSHPIYPDEKSSKHNIQLSDQYSMLNKSESNQLGSRLQSPIDSSNLQKSNNPNDNKSDESNTSLTPPELTNHNKPIFLMPNVPQCKTNTSSDDDDDDYDEVYLISPNNSPIQQTTSKHQKSNKLNSNLNINASIYRKNRTLHMRRSVTKRFHHKDK